MLSEILTRVGPYEIEFIPAHHQNVFPSDDGLHEQSCEGVVEHIMVGTMEGCISHFQSATSEASANFAVGKDGRIVQFVRLYNTAPFANGVKSTAEYLNAMSALVRNLTVKHRYTSQNKWTWSVEHEGLSGDQVVDFPEQFEASTWLTATLLASLPEERRRTFGHYMFDGINKRFCPGWHTETWNAFDARVNERVVEILSGTPVNPIEPVVLDLSGVRRSLDEAWEIMFRHNDELREKLSGVYQEMRKIRPDF